MKRRSPYAVALAWTSALVLLLGAGCGGSGAAQEEGRVRPFRLDLGRAPSQDLLASLAAQGLRQVGYQLRSPTTRRIETEWDVRSPTPAQQSLGLRAIRERAMVEINPRGRQYAVARLRVSYEVQEEGLPGWEPRPLPEDQQDLYRALARDIKQRLERYMTQDQ